MEVPKPIKPPAESAKLWFIRASILAPVSITAQADSIAERCLERDVNPVDLGEALLDKRILVHHIRKVAIKRHKQSGRGPTKIPMSDLRDIIDNDFYRAYELLILTPEQLRSIYTEVYSRAKVEYDRTTNTIENYVKDYVNETMLASHGKALF